MDLYDIKTAYPANSAVRAATARRNSRTSPEEEPQCPGVSAAGSSVR